MVSGETPGPFAPEVRPVLEQHCLPCHGPDTQLSGMDVTSLEGVLAGEARHGPTIPCQFRKF